MTGSSRGIGAAIALLLAAEGAAVVVHGPGEQRTSDVAAAISNGGGARWSAISPPTAPE